MEIQPIARIQNDFDEKFGVPRQSGLFEGLSKIIFEEEYRNPDALRGLEGFSHLWLIWHFSENEYKEFSPTVRPPRLGGNTRMGVFATRSSFRPNGLALSSVKIEKIDLESKDGPVILVSGADLMSGTPIFDIKPYIRYTDSHPDAVCGFVDENEMKRYEVTFANGVTDGLDGEFLKSLESVLSLNPAPRYQKDENRIYRMSFGKKNVEFQIKGDKVTVIKV